MLLFSRLPFPPCTGDRGAIEILGLAPNHGMYADDPPPPMHRLDPFGRSTHPQQVGGLAPMSLCDAC
jgi:hypothetical protein